MVPSEPAPSLLGRLWNWLTVEVPDEGAPGGSAPGGSAPGGSAPGGSAPGGSVPDEPAPQHRRRSSEAADPLGRTLPVPAGNQFDVEQAGVDREQANLAAQQGSLDMEVTRIARRDRRGAPPSPQQVPSPGASGERSEAPARRWPRSRRRAAAGLALVALCAAGVLAVRARHPGPGPAAATATPHPAAPASAPPPSPSPPPSAATQAATPSARDCASMQMQPVVPPASVGHAVVGGLCYTLHSARGWLVGCAPGFQAACDPSLQAVIDCLRQAGAHQHGVITDRNVWACDVPVGSGGGSAGGPPGQPPPAA